MGEALWSEASAVEDLELVFCGNDATDSFISLVNFFKEELPVSFMLEKPGKWE